MNVWEFIKEDNFMAEPAPQKINTPYGWVSPEVYDGLYDNGFIDAQERKNLLWVMRNEGAGKWNAREDLTYKSPERIVKIFGNNATFKGMTHAQKIEKAKTLVNNPELLGNTIYGANPQLGNKHEGDGYKYRSTGGFGVTGRWMTEKVLEHAGLPKDLDPEEIVKDEKLSNQFTLGYLSYKLKGKNVKDLKTLEKIIGSAASTEERLKNHPMITDEELARLDKEREERIKAKNEKAKPAKKVSLEQHPMFNELKGQYNQGLISLGTFYEKLQSNPEDEQV